MKYDDYGFTLKAASNTLGSKSTPSTLPPLNPVSPSLQTSPSKPAPKPTVDPDIPVQDDSIRDLNKYLEDQWTKLLQTWDPTTLERKHKKIKKLCRVGIPQSLRGKVWQHLSGSQSLLTENPKKYKDLVNAPELPIYDVIERDIHRCYPNHVLFRKLHGIGQESLRDVLRAYAQYNPEIGYCQGMGFLAGLFLMYMPAEESFWLLVATLDTYLKGYYMPDMVQIRADAAVFEDLIKESVSKRLSKHLDTHDIRALLYITQWFLTMFTMMTPWKTVLRIWDVFYSEGHKVVFRAGLGILQVSKEHLLHQCPGTAELITFLLHVPPEFLDADKLFREMFRLKLQRRTIAKLERKAKKKIPVGSSSSPETSPK